MVVNHCLRLSGIARLCRSAERVFRRQRKQSTQMCVGCHGILGWRTAFPEVYKVPKLGGQHEAYIVKALQEYKSGERTHPSMRAIAASLSDREMADLAAYYSAPAATTASK
ncbi:MAG: cytochrome c [Betaproteobacteria bacterium]|nr:MAG: cytochrome c [Betaproteobacteria bacterium]